MTTTAKFVLAVVFLAIVYDVYALIKYGPLGTISSVVHTATQKYPAIALAAGIVIGHLFWPNC